MPFFCQIKIFFRTKVKIFCKWIWKLIIYIFNKVCSIALPIQHAICLRFSIALKRFHDHRNSFKGKTCNWLWLTIHSCIILSSCCIMMSWTQTWCLGWSCDFYILTCRHQDVFSLTKGGLNICKTSKATSIITHFLQPDHRCSNKAIPLNNAMPFGDHFVSNPILSLL